MVLFNYLKQNDFERWDMDAFSISEGFYCPFTNKTVELNKETLILECSELEKHSEELRRILLERHYEEILELGINQKMWFE